MRGYSTPAVSALAKRHGVDLASVKGTGTGGRVTIADVTAAAARRRMPAAVEAIAVTSGARFPVSAQSRLTDVSRLVTVDAYARNPLLEDLRQIAPAVAADRARVAGPAPTLFVGGDLPPFTASNQDPALLLRLPWMVRHAAARASAQRLTDLFNELDGGPTAALIARATELGMRDDLEVSALFSYDARFRDWLGVRSIPSDYVVSDGRTASERAREGLPASDDIAASAEVFAMGILGTNPAKRDPR